MYLDNSFTWTLLSDVVSLIIAVFMYKFLPKKINHLYGYGTAKSMKNQDS
ncbi:hypothetical protein SAMN02745246_02260 [Leeuwenhoekiella marinoflava DSM 3653]|uniref:Uncharacterized protein n=2 Tax=Leeuwenhoekiella marinoflava TaxID=988 RepID=A0A4Q0PL15_9FLAO|nr:hypothetical protein DSL99_2123 [Leeuwenhoekiella marinoflava]SHF34413.1 hypothetical protein SAMN02745246_02260 [Leeuwenhoekiella marinoflava DSM 3653]